MCAAAALDYRIPLTRPRGYETRLRTTLRALRRIRIDDDGLIRLVDEDDDERNDNDFRLPRPSMAALQLYLFNEREYGVTYVENPLVYVGSAANPILDIGASLQRAREMVENLRLAGETAGDIAPGDTAAALTKMSEFEHIYPELYNALRMQIMLHIEALKPVPLNLAQTDAVLRRVLALPDAPRAVEGINDSLAELRSHLLTGDHYSRMQRDLEAKRLMERVVLEVLPLWRAQLLTMPRPTPRDIKREQFNPGTPIRSRRPPPPQE